MQCKKNTMCNKNYNNDSVYSIGHDKSSTNRNNIVHRENPFKDKNEQKFSDNEHNGYYKITNLPTKGRSKQGLEPEALTQHQPDCLQGGIRNPKEEHTEDQQHDIKLKPLPITHRICIIYCALLLSLFHTCSCTITLPVSKCMHIVVPRFYDYVKVI